MKLAEFVVPEAILADLQATGMEPAFREMVGALCAAGCVDEADSETVVQAILAREALGSTAFGPDDVAFPEARHPIVSGLFGTIAVSRRGVEFDPAAGGLIHILFLVISTPSRPAEFLRAEEIISWLLLRHEEFRDRLRRAGTREEIVALLAEADRDTLWEEGRVRR